MLLPWYTKPQLPSASPTWLLANGGIQICINWQGRASTVPGRANTTYSYVSMDAQMQSK